MISVIVATYGSERWEALGNEALTSVVATEPQVVYQIIRLHLPDGTLAQARNTAAISATGDWLCFLDADDSLSPGYLEAVEDAIASHYYAQLAIYIPRVQYGDQEPYFPNEGRWPQLNICVIGTVVPRKMFHFVGGFREKTRDGTPLSIYEDYELMLRLHYEGGADLVRVPAAVYRASANGGGRNSGRQGPEVYAAIWRERPWITS